MENDSDTSKISEEEVSKVVTTTQTKRKIIITGDSHARGYAKRLREQLGNSFSITGFIKLNADLNNITNSTKAEKKNMMENDEVILCGGMKNIGKNETCKGLCCISQFLEHQLHTKVLIMEAPYRHNLILTSCVNKEVANFNRKLQKITKKFYNAETVKMSTKRDHFTQHGLHMNGSGKDWIASLLATKIRQILTTHMPKPPIHLTWKAEASEDDIEARKVKEVRNSPSHESDLNKQDTTSRTQQAVYKAQ